MQKLIWKPKNQGLVDKFRGDWIEFGLRENLCHCSLETRTERFWEWGSHGVDGYLAPETLPGPASSHCQAGPVISLAVFHLKSEAWKTCFFCPSLSSSCNLLPNEREKTKQNSWLVNSSLLSQFYFIKNFFVNTPPKNDDTRNIGHEQGLLTDWGQAQGPCHNETVSPYDWVIFSLKSPFFQFKTF